MFFTCFFIVSSLLTLPYIMRSDWKMQLIFMLKYIIAVKDTLPLIHYKIFPLASKTLIALFLPFSEAVGKVLFHVLSCAMSWIYPKRFPFTVNNDFTKRQKSQIQDPGCKVSEETPYYFGEAVFPLEGTWRQQSLYF